MALEVLESVPGRAHFVGLSLGGMIGMWVATNRPERVDKLVLACTSAQLGPESMWRERAATVRRDGTGAVADGVIGRWFTAGLRERRPDLVAATRAMVAATSADGYAGCCDAIAEMDQTAGIASIVAPTLVIAGADDPATPVPHAALIAGTVPGARLEVIADAAHLAAVEQPGMFAALVLDHLLADPVVAGMAVRRQVLGDAHVDAATARGPADFQEFITRYAWGGVWTRPGLDRRTRSAITLAALVALGREGELAMHLRAALGNGLTEAELTEILLHTAVYAGVPAANAAFAVLRTVLG